jgi:uncharacterized membrane protein
MMLIEIVRHTPVWVWALLAALLVLGRLTQLRTRTVSRARLFVLPAVLGALGLTSTATAFQPAAPAMAAWGVALLLGALLGQHLPTPTGARWDATGRRLRLPGSVLPLLVILAVFTLRYTASVALALHPAWREMREVALPLAAVYGAIAGLLLGRMLALLPRARDGATTMPADAHDQLA